jgi:hypothetical protein
MSDHNVPFGGAWRERSHNWTNSPIQIEIGANQQSAESERRRRDREPAAQSIVSRPDRCGLSLERVRGGSEARFKSNAISRKRNQNVVHRAQPECSET